MSPGKQRGPGGDPDLRENRSTTPAETSPPAPMVSMVAAVELECPSCGFWVLREAMDEALDRYPHDCPGGVT